ncbi:MULTISPECIES: hypothetical protein [Streptomyces]|uniref:hypothetical protein n=1 Tax=Streptomyces herbicida TaxID=3065675 RepID=UPI00292D7607|nr:hypothetical protein [Streptomyces sp. NEAU-HV9]
METRAADGETDRQLADFLGEDAAEGLAQWRRSSGWAVSLPAAPWTSRGYTDAFVASLVLRPPGGDDLNLVAKVVPRDNRREPDAHRRALDDAAAQGTPGAAEFARRHLVELVAQAGPVDTPAGRTIYFQHLAGGTALCRPVADLERPRQAEELVDTCLMVARAVAAEWNGSVRRTEQTVAAFLDEELRGPLSGTGSVDRWAAVAGLTGPAVRWIVTAEDPEPLPNPLPTAFGRTGQGDRKLDVLTACVHGDLHLGNILVVQDEQGGVQPQTFRLIDLSTYRCVGPRVRDQIQLLLSAVAWLWPDLSALQRQALLTDLTHPHTAAHPRQDPLVARLISGVHDATWSLVEPKGFGDAWLRQYTPALQAAALRFTTFTSFSAELRWWFMRLACRAAGRWAALTGARIGSERPRLLKNPFTEQPSTSAPPGARAPTRPVALGGRLLGELPRLRRPDAEGTG